MDSIPAFWEYLQRFIEQRANKYPELVQCFRLFLQRLEAVGSESLGDLAAEWFEELGKSPACFELSADLAKTVPLSAYSEYAGIIRMAPTVRHAMKMVSEFHEDLIPLVSYQFDDFRDGGVFHIGFRLPLSDAAVDAFMLGFTISLDLDLSRVTGKTRNVSVIHVSSESEEIKQHYQSHLGVSPILGSGGNWIDLPEKLLAHPNPFADEISFNKQIEELREKIKNSSKQRPLNIRVRELMTKRIASPPTLEELAEQLNMSVRQLRFSLSKEGFSYRILINECRMEVAKTLLCESNSSISEVADRLGYSDVSAFNHGFKRWTGTTPAKFKKQRPARR